MNVEGQRECEWCAEMDRDNVQTPEHVMVGCRSMEGYWSQLEVLWGGEQGRMGEGVEQTIRCRLIGDLGDIWGV